MVTGDAGRPADRDIRTSGGAYVEGGVSTGGGDFVGRDKIVHIHNYPPISRAPLRKIFDPLIENRTELFGGREAILGRLADLIQAPAAAYVVITAPAGFGKTALMARLISLKPDAFAYHFFTPLYGDSSLTESFFLENVAEQMGQWFDDPGQLPKDLNQLRAHYHDYIDRPLDQDRVLILDGLDEVTGWRLAPYLNRRLPDRLHLILTIRDTGQDWRAKYELPAGQTIHLPLGGLDRADVAAVLRAAGGGAIALADDDLLLDEVLRVAAYQADERLGADPFYVRYLADDAAAGRLTPANLAGQPRGLDRYLDGWWKTLSQQMGDRPVNDLFGTLTVARGPLRQADLEALNPSLVDELLVDFLAEKVLPRVQRWVVGDPERGYALAHPRLRQYMQTRLKTGPYLDRLLAYCADWPQHRSPYALTYYAGHLKAAGQVEPLYNLVLDTAYRNAQVDVLGDASTTLSDLRLALDVALQNDDLRAILACVGAYRETVRSRGLSAAIFQAVDGRDFSRALKLATFYHTARDWPWVLHLYLAWEAALAGDEEACRQALQVSARFYLVQTDRICEALRVRIAFTRAGGDPDRALALLSEEEEPAAAESLLASYALAPPLPDAEAQTLAETLEPGLQQLEVMAAQGNAEAISEVAFLDNVAGETWLYAADLRTTLMKLAGHPQGRTLLRRVLATVLPNPYPRYRDIALTALGVVAAVSPDPQVTRETLRVIIATGLDQEGVTFTFDLPAMLLAFAQERQLGDTAGLADYSRQATAGPDRWGTPLRGISAQAAARFRRGDPAGAEAALEPVVDYPRGFAGLSTLHLLALANRWWEFGRPERITGSLSDWQPSSLLDVIANQAGYIRDDNFRHETLQLVEAYRAWTNRPAPDTATGLAEVNDIPDAATRLAYIEHLSARWAWPPARPNWTGLKALVPLALADGTTLDAVLARLVGLYLADPVRPVSNAGLAEAVRLCHDSLTTGRPWEQTYAIEVG